MLEELPTYCPCCGEPITLLVDTTMPEQEYVEDCEVCCRPMIVSATVTGDVVQLALRSEDA